MQYYYYYYYPSVFFTDTRSTHALMWKMCHMQMEHCQHTHSLVNCSKTDLLIVLPAKTQIMSNCLSLQHNGNRHHTLSFKI